MNHGGVDFFFLENGVSCRLTLFDFFMNRASWRKKNCNLNSYPLSRQSNDIYGLIGKGNTATPIQFIIHRSGTWMVEESRDWLEKSVTSGELVEGRFWQNGVKAGMVASGANSFKTHFLALRSANAPGITATIPS